MTEQGSQGGLVAGGSPQSAFPPSVISSNTAAPFQAASPTTQNAEIQQFIQQYQQNLQGQQFPQAGPNLQFSKSQPLPQNQQEQSAQYPLHNLVFGSSQPQFPFSPPTAQQVNQPQSYPVSAASSGPTIYYGQGTNSQGLPPVPSSLNTSAGFLSRLEQQHQTYGYRTLFRFSKKSEILFMMIGFLCALAAGVCIALMFYLFGQLTNAMVLIDMIDRNGSAFNTTSSNNKTPFCIAIPSDINGILSKPDTRNVVIGNHVTNFVVRHLVLAALLAFLSTVYFMIWFACGERQINRLSIGYFEAILRKDMKWLDTRHEDSDYANSVVEHTQRIREGIGENVAVVGFLVAVFGACMALACIEGWELTIVLFLALPLLIGATYFVANAEANLVIEETKGYSKAGTLAQEILINIRTVMVYGGQKREFFQYNKQLDHGHKKILRRVFHASLANGFIWFLTFAYYALFFWYGTKRVIDDRAGCRMGESSYTPSDLVIIFFGLMFGAINVGIAFPMLESIMNARRSSMEIFRIIDTTSEVDNLSMDGYLPNRPAVGKIEMIDVYFTYPAERANPVLRGVSFSVNPGMIVALVGIAGAGKSTVLKLLTKEYLADSGFIKLDGIDVRAYNTWWLRSQIAVVTQESNLFDDTIEENVRVGKPNASFVEVQMACQQANAHNFITQLKHGYQTKAGFQGSKLTAGQRQQISLARALIRNPKILLLDEPTSALDSQTEALVQDALRKASMNRTTFVVAHRLNTIVNSDLILVFHHGRIRESGKHFELLDNKKSIYSELASGLYNKASKEEPKHDDEKTKAAILYRQHRSSLKILDNIICTPYRNPHVFPVGDKIIRQLQKKSICLVKEEPNDELIFRINPLPNLGGQGDTFGSNLNNTFIGNKDHAAIPVTMTSHTDSDIRMERTLWQSFTRKMEPEKPQAQPGFQQQQQQQLQQFQFTQQIEYSPPKKDKLEFYSVLKMVSSSFILIIMGMIASIVLGFALPLYGILFGDFIGELSNPKQEVGLTNCAMWALLFLGLAVVAGFAAFWQSLSLKMAGFKTVIKVRKRILFSILRHDAGWFDDPDNGVSTLSNRLNIDAGSIQYILPSFFGVLIQSLVTIIIGVAYSVYFSWRLTVYCIFLVPFVVGASWLDGWLSKLHQQKTIQTMDELSKIVSEVFQNRHVVVTAQLERYFIMKYERTLAMFGKSGWKIIIGRSLSFGFAQSMVFLAYSICILLSGIEMTRENPVKYEDVLKVGEGLLFALLTVGTSLSVIPSLMKAVAAGNRILKILRSKPKWEYDVGGQDFPVTAGAIDFRNVQFWYPHASDVQILKGISFSVRPGQMVALVGSSGSGKSSCAHLILRFHDTTYGNVLIDGLDLRTLNCASVRSHMAIVEQQPLLFDRSVEENIAYGDNTRMVRVEEVIAAAKATNIHAFITSLPEGYQTKVGGFASLLSAQQKQQISIARALIRNPRILVINEAAGALDHESEKNVWETLDMARKGRSCVVVSHHLSSIQNADLIIVLHQGGIIEFGKHDALLSKRGLYYLLWSAQNPMSNTNFTGRFKLLNTIFGRKPDAAGTTDIIQELASYAQTAIVQKPKDIYAPTAEIAGTGPGDVNPPPGQPAGAQDDLCAWCNIFSMG